LHESTKRGKTHVTIAGNPAERLQGLGRKQGHDQSAGSLGESAYEEAGGNPR
jgi:hypothetical protein